MDHEAVSPLSPRSNAILAQRNSGTGISPLSSPDAPPPISREARRIPGVYKLPAKAYAMPERRPSGGRQLSNESPVSEHTPGRDSVRSQISNVSPRSKAFPILPGFLEDEDVTHQIPLTPIQQTTQTPPFDIPTFLQEFTTPSSIIHSRPQPHSPPQADHLEADASSDITESQLFDEFYDVTPRRTPTSPRSRRPSSQTLPSQPIQAELSSYAHRACTACGSLQKNTHQPFIPCKKCTGIYFCTVECWDKRVCHSRPGPPPPPHPPASISPEKSCGVCSLPQSATNHPFEDCGKCKDVGKAVFFCSDRCWDMRSCHVRATPTIQLKPAVVAPVKPKGAYYPGARSEQVRKEWNGVFDDLPKQYAQPDQRAQNSGQQHDTAGRAPEAFRIQQEGVPEDVPTEVTVRQVFNNKTIALIAVVVLTFIIILSLVIGLKG